VVFWPHNPALPEPYRQQLEAEGILLLADCESRLDLAGWVQDQQPVLDWLLLSRPDVAEAVLEAMIPQPWLKLAYYGHDLHHRRLERQANFFNDQSVANQAALAEEQEHRIWKQVELILYPSRDEVNEVTDWIKKHGLRAKACQIPVYAYSDEELLNGPNTNIDSAQLCILFVAGFAHPPNVDSAEWFLKRIWPKIRSKLESVSLCIVGSNPSAHVKAIIELKPNNLGIYTHWNVDDQQLERLYSSAQIAIAPIVYGAGLNGKIVEALRYGLPCVTTSHGARGFDKPTGGLFLADGEEEFADACVEILTNPALREQLSKQAKLTVQSYFSQTVLAKALSPIFSTRAKNNTMVSI
jgi:glycosyltransferase involved in cell wall biosynthesis